MRSIREGGKAKMKGLRFKGSQRVPKGSYWNFTTGERVRLEAGGVLPGSDKDMYFNFPPIIILFAGPFLGLVYALFLPIIGVVMLVKIISGYLYKGAIRKLMNAMVFSWRPHESYLNGQKRRH